MFTRTGIVVKQKNHKSLLGPEHKSQLMCTLAKKGINTEITISTKVIIDKKELETIQ